jgi:hypothetical protein
MPDLPSIARIVRHYWEMHGGGRTLDDLGKQLRARGENGSSSAISAWLNGERLPRSRSQVEALRDIVGCMHFEFDVESIHKAWSAASVMGDRRDHEPRQVEVGSKDEQGDPRHPDAAPPRVTRRRIVFGTTAIGVAALVPVALCGGKLLLEAARQPLPSRLSIVSSQVVYLPAGDDELGSVVDIRLANSGGSIAQIHQLTVTIEEVARYEYRPCSHGCLPRTGSQAAIVYSISVQDMRPGQTIERDVGITVEPGGVERLALAFADVSANSCTVARIRVGLDADGTPMATDSIVADILVIAGPANEPLAHQLTDHQLALTLQDAALPVLTTKDVRAELIGRNLTVPPWLEP